MIDFAQKNIMQNELILRTISCKRRSKLSEEETARLRKRYEREVEDILSAQEAGIPYCIRAEDMDEVLERV